MDITLKFTVHVDTYQLEALGLARKEDGGAGAWHAHSCALDCSRSFDLPAKLSSRSGCGSGSGSCVGSGSG